MPGKTDENKKNYLNNDIYLTNEETNTIFLVYYFLI